MKRQFPVASQKSARTLVLIGHRPSDELLREIDSGLAPRIEYLDIARELQADIISAEHWTPPLAKIAKRAPLFASGFAAFLQRNRYATIYTTGEDLGMRLAPILRIGGWKGRLICIVHGCTSERRKTFFRILGPRAFHALVCVSEAQRDILTRDVGLPGSKVHALHNGVDTTFYRPDPQRDGDGAFVFSCGLENRDYATLMAAAARCSFPFKVAASGFHGLDGGLGKPPGNVEILGRRVSYAELQQTYAGARFAVVPLHAVPYAAGINGLLEAMSAGLAVVVTDSPGIREYLEGAQPGFIVPPGDDAALAEAAQSLWDRPERCREIGARNRQWCQEHATVNGFVTRVCEMLASHSAEERIAS